MATITIRTYHCPKCQKSVSPFLALIVKPYVECSHCQTRVYVSRDMVIDNWRRNFYFLCVLLIWVALIGRVLATGHISSTGQRVDPVEQADSGDGQIGDGLQVGQGLEQQVVHAVVGVRADQHGDVLVAGDKLPQNLGQGGLTTQGPPGLNTIDYEAKLPASTQFSGAFSTRSALSAPRCFPTTTSR